jgi:hypothetical protein
VGGLLVCLRKKKKKRGMWEKEKEGLSHLRNYHP